QVDQEKLVLARDRQAAVAEVERLSEGGAEDLGRARGLAPPDLGSAARSHLSACQIDDTEAVAALSSNDERTSASQLHVVGVGPDRDQFNCHPGPIPTNPTR